MAVERALSPQDISRIRSDIPKLMQAVYGRGYINPSIVFTGDCCDATDICAPLTSADLDRINRCPEIINQTVKAVYLPDEENEAMDVALFQVRYDFSGIESSGAPFLRTWRARLHIHCHTEGEKLIVTGIESYPDHAPETDQVSKSAEISARPSGNTFLRRTDNWHDRNSWWLNLLEAILDIFFDY